MRFTRTLAACLVLASPLAAEEPITAELRPGWRLPNGDHVAALHLTLAPGWHTYWRAPGDAGIPPLFDWAGSENVGDLGVIWPTPRVFWQSGMRSIGYEEELVLPIRIRPRSDGDIRLTTEMQLGLCKDICLPHTLHISAVLPPQTKPDPMIASAMASVPFTKGEAQVGKVHCAIRPDSGGLTLRTEIEMPTSGGAENAVIEPGLPEVWASEPATSRVGNTLVTETRLRHMEGKPIMLDRSRVRITVLGKDHAVDIQGCDS
ncbi:protein-disulfide reductase DsbD family protein [Salipiger sp. 1_MG-2023]|uniref:protein-disulfide reductase DsbD domain-containing protein n=1 Tax=Salipiger sp. 1_MG-2023 TaxID=3062665 RepID=UPI0026E124C5|nr:protein-disulfide reductase DsbD domain-containing protein [Salipiger sp. 1_MG-2023]MDO6585636.1 protein-disulfide reductase DsbD family protein [Salipiger sp. 1_MG-2023]